MYLAGTIIFGSELVAIPLLPFICCSSGLSFASRLPPRPCHHPSLSWAKLQLRFLSRRTDTSYCRCSYNSGGIVRIYRHIRPGYYPCSRCAVHLASTESKGLGRKCDPGHQRNSCWPCLHACISSLGDRILDVREQRWQEYWSGAVVGGCRYCDLHSDCMVQGPTSDGDSIWWRPGSGMVWCRQVMILLALDSPIPRSELVSVKKPISLSHAGF
jgi:hypothetical protein